METTLSRGEGRKILIVEDIAEMLWLFKRMVEAFGFQVATARSEEQALLLFQSDPEIYGVLTDMNFSRGKTDGRDGEVLAQKLRMIRPEVPIIFMSGEHDILRQFPEEQRLTKPFLKEKLGEKLLLFA